MTNQSFLTIPDSEESLKKKVYQEMLFDFIEKKKACNNKKEMEDRRLFYFLQ